jgi:hypothetical protein
MADAVQTNVITDGSKRKVIQILNYSDGTGEADVVKLDVSADDDADYYSIQEIQYDIGGFTGVTIKFDATTDDEGVYLPTGTGYKNFGSMGGLPDPKSTGWTGDILVSTVGAAADATYDILIHVKKKRS